MGPHLALSATLLLAACQRDTEPPTGGIPARAVTDQTAPPEDRGASTGGDSADPASTESGTAIGDAETAPPAPYPTAFVDEVLKRFGDAAEHTQEELKVIELVERYLEGYKQIPKPHRHLVERRGSVRVVTVMSLEHLRDPGLRAPSLYVHVRQGTQGLFVEKTSLGM